MGTGLAYALAASGTYGVATVVQALAVRRMAPTEAKAGSRARAVSLYGVGLLLDVVGFAASVAALQTLPLFLVQSVVASSVGVTAATATIVLHIRLSPTERFSLAIMTAGLVLLALSAEPGPAHPVGPFAGWWLLASSGLIAIILVAGVRAKGVASAMVLATASGLGFGVVGIAARVLDVRHPWWHSAADPVLVSLLVAGACAVVAYGFALDRAPATTVAAITFGVETVIPSIVGISLLGDTVRPNLELVAAAGFAATLGGCIALARLADADVAASEQATPHT
ncbi:MAG TPA: hypothetical protein VN088_09780 [Nocardioides sp.]|nr:hypothetical protein [Nocardioides sp.]